MRTDSGTEPATSDLADIERMLCTHPAVGACAAMVAEGRLVAYVVGADPAADPAAVQEAAAAQAMFWLPARMTPDTIHAVPHLPPISACQPATAVMRIDTSTPGSSTPSFAT